MAVWRTDPVTKEFVVTSLHPGVTREQMQETCGWAIRYAEDVVETPPPTELELSTLRGFQARTKATQAR
jgi:glutaconate CoA-transferase subunit B